MVAEELNITRAAERLYISQQSLSNHISNMERELNVKLFLRSPKLSLTYAGDLLVDTATQILDLHSQYLAKVGDINRNYVGLLRVGISHTCGLALLPDILPIFRKEFPQVEFSLFEGNSNQLEDELSHGRVDLIICFQPIMIEGIQSVPLTSQRLVMVVPKAFTNQLYGNKADEMRRQFAHGGDISAFAHMPFVLIKKGNRTRNIVDQYFSRYYFKPKLILETENTVTTLAMAQAGLGITICPELFLRAGPGGKIVLFNGHDFSGWTKVITAEPDSSPDRTWQIVDGVIRCSGKPFGYLATHNSYADYRLTVEYRWYATSDAMNSGVFVHKVGPDNFFLPRAIETQLKMGSAGDYVLLSKASLNGIKNDFVGCVKKMGKSSEKPQGEWNRVEITVRGNTIESRVNGVLQNKGEKMTESFGQICLQSEGGPIEFRNVFIEPLK